MIQLGEEDSYQAPKDQKQGDSSWIEDCWLHDYSLRIRKIYDFRSAYLLQSGIKQNIDRRVSSRLTVAPITVGRMDGKIPFQHQANRPTGAAMWQNAILSLCMHVVVGTLRTNTGFIRLVITLQVRIRIRR
jgi:hypothetical protein